MKSKFVISVLSLMSVAAALAGCGHQHTFSSDWSSNETQHWHAATCEHNLAINVENHFDSNGDGFCDVCNWNMSGVHTHSFSTSWSFDFAQHWHECSCGARTDIADHIDGDSDNYCDFCGYEIGKPVPHIHTFSSDWTTTPSQHWHAATCGHNVSSEQGNHVDSDNDKFCDICDYKMSSPDPGDYYASITDDMSGEALVNGLYQIISKGVSVSYDWSRYEAADEDIHNSANVTTIYARTSLNKGAHVSGSKGWNREHSFPQSKMSGNCEQDNHIIFASDCKVNGIRSNYRLGEIGGSPNVIDSYGNKTPCISGKKGGEQMFDPGDTIARGIVARATMYAYVLYGLNPTSNFESYDTLLKWHLNYQPEECDFHRNEAVYKRQKNRNPFVDHPEYACKIWGTKSATTRSLCGM